MEHEYKEVSPQEATKEQLEERIKEALEDLNKSLISADRASAFYIKSAISTLETGLPF